MEVGEMPGKAVWMRKWQAWLVAERKSCCDPQGCPVGLASDSLCYNTHMFTQIDRLLAQHCVLASYY